MNLDALSAIVKRHWGYESLRPLQAKAMLRITGHGDSLVVLPTGGGKSLCYQVPAIAMEGMAVVVSPLISLMKDQVDGLRAVGVGAAFINSSLLPHERRETHEALQRGEVKLLYVAPERLVKPEFIAYLKKLNISFIAIDEAHCISQWGHDFRPEYRTLATLREAFPDTAFHGYTATATPQVREDICAALSLKEPEVLVASADRPNLVYAVERRSNELAQVLDVVERHAGESGVIYCITRKKVEELCEKLRAKGHPALPYHAGMDAAARERNQESFSKEGAEIIVATVAFGMGIDKPDVRYVVHTGMPKSIEHYQQESGRAGRDGLEAECRLLYSGSDFGLWKTILQDQDAATLKISLEKLNEMYNYCTDVTCRHQVLLDYFGEKLEKDNCGACDLCLGNAELVEDARVIAQKIASCVARLDEVAGPSYTTLILTGSREARVIDKGHDKLSTWGLLREHPAPVIRTWIEQLVSQGYLCKKGEYNILGVTARGRDMLRGDEMPRLLKPAETRKSARKQSVAASKSWEGVDKALFNKLRDLRREIAMERNVPAFTVFGDASLRDMAKQKPRDEVAFLQVHGVGEKKCADYASTFLPVILAHEGGGTDGQPNPAPRNKPDKARERAFELFELGWDVAEISEELGRSIKKVQEYLEAYIRTNKIEDPSPWVDEAICEQVQEALERFGNAPTDQVIAHLNGKIDPAPLKIVTACLMHTA